MILQQADKELNYCDSCSNRKAIDEYNNICGLTSKPADFTSHCTNYLFDNEIELDSLKNDLDLRLKKSTKGLLNTNSVTNLIAVDLVDINRIDLNKEVRFNYLPFMRYLSVGLVSAPLIFFLIQLFKTPKEFNEVSLLLLVLSVVLFFVIRSELLVRNEIVIDKYGLKFNGRLFLWNFIEELYLHEIDHGSESESTVFLIILVKSGKEFELDTKRINLFPMKRFIRILNSYRFYGLKKETNNFSNQ